MTKQRKATAEILGVLERIELLQHAQQAALHSLAQRVDRMAQLLDAEARHSLSVPTARDATAAITMARAGAGIADMVRNCGLRAAEAELLLTLYGRRDPVATVTQVA
jgi:hypothetical protein